MFGIHCGHGGILFYYDLARYLGSEQPVYGLQAQGLDGKQVPYSRVEDMAAHYIREIRTLQPEGPYFLAGYSFGGLIAFEMAQQLYAQGQKVALLALLEPSPPVLINFLYYCLKRFDYLTNFRFINSFIYRAEYHSLRLSQLDPIWQLTYVLKRVIRTVFKFPPGVKRFQARSRQDVAPSYQDVSKDQIVKANRQARQNYIPQAYPGQITLFLTST